MFNRTCRHVALGAAALTFALPAAASADSLVRLDQSGSGPASTANVHVIGDADADELSVLRREYQAGSDPVGYAGRDIIQFLAAAGQTITRDGPFNTATFDFCSDVTPQEVICGIVDGSAVTTVGTDLGAGNDTLSVIAATDLPEIDLIASGGSGADSLGGGAGDDVLGGGSDVDNLFGNDGDDRLEARDDTVESTLLCGNGADTVIADAADVPNFDCETVDTPPNPVQLEFFTAATSRGEEQGSQILAVTEHVPSTGSGTFKIDVVGGTATKGSDFAAAFDGQVVDYEAGLTSYQVAMPILQDTDHEGDETVVLRLTSPTGDVVIGTPETITVTITDDDPSPGGGVTPTPTPIAGPTPTPAPLVPSGPVIGVPAAPAPEVPRAGQVSKRLPDFTRGGRFIAAPCKTRNYCDVNDVRAYLVSEGLIPALTIKTTSSAGDAPDPKKVVQGEVVGSTPRDGDPVAFVPGDRFPMELQVFDPKVPAKEQRCKASQKISAGADTTLGKYLVGKTLEETKATLLTFDCFSRKGPDETNVEYAITTTIKPGTRYAEVERVSDKRIDGSSATTLVVAMRVPPSELVLTVAPDATKPGLGLALADGTLTVDADTKVGLRVRVGLPAGAAPVPAGTEVTLRDPDGQLVDRALTDAAGEVLISGFIPESKRYELYASFADRDGDAMAGSVQLDAKKRTGSFAMLDGTTVTAGKGGAKAKPLATRSQALIVLCIGKTPKASNADLAFAQALAEKVYCATANQSNPNDRDAPLYRYADSFPSPVFDRIIGAAQKLGTLASGNFALAAKEGMTLSMVASGNPDGAFSVRSAAVEKSAPTLATDGQRLLQIPASAVTISDGLPAFRDSVNDVTFTIDGRIIVEGSSSQVSGGRQIVDGPALSVPAGNFSVFAAAAAAPNAAGIVAGGAGNVIAAGAGNVIAAGAGNIIAGGAGNIIAGGAGNVIAAGAGNIIAGGAGNIIAGGAGNVIAAGAGNIVAGGAGNIIAGGAGNIIAGGAGNLTAPKLGSAVAAKGNAAGQIVAGGAGN